jgi:hypothetical protein
MRGYYIASYEESASTVGSTITGLAGWSMQGS